MYLVAIGWLYVAFMMALVEATSAQGSLLGAAFTFMLYGVGPVALLMYLLGTPGRKRRLRQQAIAQADAGHETPAATAVAAERVEP
ncbi:MAG: hypothetical protein KAY56_10310 [Inhella sp.]|nr:hypothetical protein [Inhella sp.]